MGFDRFYAGRYVYLAVLGMGVFGASVMGQAVGISPNLKRGDRQAMTRSFALAFTTFPYDFNDQAQGETYDFIDANADMVAFHHDRGVPWPEAFEGLGNYHPNLIAEIDEEIAGIRPGEMVYVSVTAQGQHRDGELANYWGEDSNMPLPVEWQGKRFDDPDVATAYLDWCRYLLDRFEPDYFTYSIESNAGFHGVDDPSFVEFLVFLNRVYPVLKIEYPDTAVILSVQSGSDASPRDEFLVLTDVLLDYTDIVGISTYPYFQFLSDGWHGFGDPATLAPDLISAITDLAPQKPMAIAETGYAAEDLSIPEFGIFVEAREEWQAAYVEWLLLRVDRMDGEFVVWFVSRDYDNGLDFLAKLGIEIPPVFYIWRDNGLLDGDGVARDGLGVWRSWLTLEREP